MTNLFGTSNEQYLNGVVLYLKAADSILYKESTYTTAISKAELANLFKKGILVVDTGSAFIRPSELVIASGYAEVSYTTVGASDKAVKTAFYSDGYSAT